MSLLQDIARRGQYFPFDNLAQSSSGVFRGINAANETTIEQSVELLLAQYQYSENIKNTLRAILYPVIELENIIKIDFPNQFSIQLAFGVWLDILGDYVGEERNGLDDNEYLSHDNVKNIYIFRVFQAIHNRHNGYGLYHNSFFLSFYLQVKIEISSKA